jgi:hypothetical protein
MDIISAGAAWVLICVLVYISYGRAELEFMGSRDI